MKLLHQICDGKFLIFSELQLPNAPAILRYFSAFDQPHRQAVRRAELSWLVDIY